MGGMPGHFQEDIYICMSKDLEVHIAHGLGEA